MKKNILAIAMIVILTMALSACAPSFKSMRDADNYLSEQRLKADQEATYKVRDITTLRTIGANMSVISPIGWSEGPQEPASSVALKRTMADIYPARRGNHDPYRISIMEGTIDFKRREAINRKTAAGEEWDLLSEAFKETEKMSSCRVVRTIIRKVVGSSTSKVPEGEITVATEIRFDMYFTNPNSAEPTCMNRDAQKYVEAALGKAAGKINPQIKPVITAQ